MRSGVPGNPPRGPGFGHAVGPASGTRPGRLFAADAAAASRAVAGCTGRPHAAQRPGGGDGAGPGDCQRQPHDGGEHAAGRSELEQFFSGRPQRGALPAGQRRQRGAEPGDRQRPFRDLRRADQQRPRLAAEPPRGAVRPGCQGRCGGPGGEQLAPERRRLAGRPLQPERRQSRCSGAEPGAIAQQLRRHHRPGGRRCAERWRPAHRRRADHPGRRKERRTRRYRGAASGRQDHGRCRRSAQPRVPACGRRAGGHPCGGREPERHRQRRWLRHRTWRRSLDQGQRRHRRCGPQPHQCRRRAGGGRYRSSPRPHAPAGLAASAPGVRPAAADR